MRMRHRFLQVVIRDRQRAGQARSVLPWVVSWRTITTGQDTCAAHCRLTEPSTTTRGVRPLVSMASSLLPRPAVLPLVLCPVHRTDQVLRAYPAVDRAARTDVWNGVLDRNRKFGTPGTG